MSLKREVTLIHLKLFKCYLKISFEFHFDAFFIKKTSLKKCRIGKGKYVDTIRNVKR